MEDLIKREDAIKAVKCRFNADLMDKIDAMLMTSAIAQITKNIANIPAVEPKQGEWIDCGYSIRCSECRYDMPWAVRNYCPNCGARMKGSDDETD